MKAAAAAHQKIDNVIACRVIKRVLVEIIARALAREGILDDLGQHRARTVGHQHDLVGEIDRLIHVMRDHEDGLPGFLTDAADFILQGAAREGVECRKWLIHQHDLRLDRQRTGNANPLFHATG